LPSIFETLVHTLHHRSFQLFLAVGQQGVNFTVRGGADGVNLFSECLAGGSWILIEQRLNLVVMFLKQRSNLFLLFWSQLQILCQVIEFLIHRSRTVDRLKFLAGRRRRIPGLSRENTRHNQCERKSKYQTACVFLHNDFYMFIYEDDLLAGLLVNSFGVLPHA